MSYETEERLLTIGKWLLVLAAAVAMVWGVTYSVTFSLDCWGKGGQVLETKYSIVCLPGAPK